MLKPVRMCRIECIVGRERKDAVISRLHREGAAQIDNLSGEELTASSLVRDRPSERLGELSALLARISAVSEALKPYSKDDAGFLEEMLGVRRRERMIVGRESCSKIMAEAEGALAPLELAVASEGRCIAAFREEGSRLQDRLKRLQPVADLEVPSSLLRSGEYLETAFGTISKDGEKTLTDVLTEVFASEHAVERLQSAGGTALVVNVLRGREAELEQALRASGFEAIPLDGDGTPKDMFLQTASRLAEIEAETAKSAGKLSSIHATSHRGLEALKEQLSIEYERCQATARLGATEEASYLRLWVPREKQAGIVDAIEEASGGLCAFDIDPDPKDAPTLLDNPPLLAPFESLTRMYSPPRYNQIDPTAITAPTFVIFFGFMAGDAVYGLITTAVSYMLRKRYGKYSKGVNDFFYIMMCCGLSTILFGVMTGGYLADFLTKYVLGIATRDMPFVVIDPLYKSNAVLLLSITVAVGVLQIVFGHVLGMLDKLSRREYKGVLTDNLSWLLIFASVPALIMWSKAAALAVFAAGFILLFWGSGILAFLTIPGSVGNFVSYSRLLALNLTSPGVGMAFNFLSSLLWNIPLVGPIIAVALFITTHSVMLLMNPIGAFVHSLRLHYVEFYGAFYDGGGIEFQPFMERREHTILRR